MQRFGCWSSRRDGPKTLRGLQSFGDLGETWRVSGGKSTWQNDLTCCEAGIRDLGEKEPKSKKRPMNPPETLAVRQGFEF